MAATTNDYIPKQHPCIITQLPVGQKSGQSVALRGCLHPVSQAEINVVAGLWSFLEARCMSSFRSWAEFIPCGCRIGAPISSPAVGQRSLSTSKDHLAGSLLQSQQWRVKSLSAALLGPLPFHPISESLKKAYALIT